MQAFNAKVRGRPVVPAAPDEREAAELREPEHQYERLRRACHAVG